MGVLLVVMLKSDDQIANRRLGIRLGHEGDVVALHGLHEALGHPVALRLQTGVVSGFKPMADANALVLSAV